MLKHRNEIAVCWSVASMLDELRRHRDEAAVWRCVRSRAAMAGLYMKREMVSSSDFRSLGDFGSRL